MKNNKNNTAGDSGLAVIDAPEQNQASPVVEPNSSLIESVNEAVVGAPVEQSVSTDAQPETETPAVNDTADVQPITYPSNPWGVSAREIQNATSCADAMASANMNWGFALEQIVTKQGVALEDRFMIVRDNGQPLETCASNYQNLQNSQAFGFLDEYTQNNPYVYGFELFGGLSVHLIAKVTDGEFEVAPGHSVGLYLLASNFFDAKTKMSVSLVAIDQKYNAILQTLATQEFRHTGSLPERTKEISKLLSDIPKLKTQAEKQYRKLASKKITNLDTVLGSVFKQTKNAGQANKIASLKGLITGLDTNIGGTAYGVYATLCYQTDWVKGSTYVREDLFSARLNRVLFSGDSSFKVHALKTLG